MSPRANLRVVPLPRATSSLVPHFDVTVHIVLDDYGKAGRVYRETDEEDTSVGSVVDVAREVLRGVAERGRPLAANSRQFVGAYVDEDELLRAESGVA